MPVWVISLLTRRVVRCFVVVEAVSCVALLPHASLRCEGEEICTNYEYTRAGGAAAFENVGRCSAAQIKVTRP